ncbi:hypothetical protein M9H77_16350 [Catharanthus roseus]|uniref:Uncharacterized protein n=1 Tax=Catharanthus roseus TaxID=4058 RepID=A0ACC0B1I6_CATRO|nr:hypothetical protein M9H77_16350 [Catharanthus roseus]
MPKKKSGKERKSNYSEVKKGATQPPLDQLPSKFPQTSKSHRALHNHCSSITTCSASTRSRCSNNSIIPCNRMSTMEAQRQKMFAAHCTSFAKPQCLPDSSSCLHLGQDRSAIGIRLCKLTLVANIG